jgi:hypothetical protein
MSESLDMSYASFVSNETNSQLLENQVETPPSPPSASETSQLWISQDALPPLPQPVNRAPSTAAFIKGHAQYFVKSAVQFIFKDNNLPLLINLVYHLIAARALLGKPWKTVTRYLSIPPTPKSSANLKFQIEQTTSIAMDAFKAQGALHLAFAALAGLALKERRQSSERSALLVLTLSAFGQTWAHVNAYWKSNQQYTLKALQEVCTSDLFITFISAFALSKTVKRTGKLL